MHFKTKAHLLNILLFPLLLSTCGYGQKINVELNGVDSLRTMNSENLVTDVNGEICSMIILTTNLSGMKFYSNLGVEKILKIENGYRIWIPNKANILKLTIPGFPLYEYNLPHSDYKYSVYIISGETEKNEKIIILDTLRPDLSFVTIPAKARIFLDGGYIGESPIVIKNPDFYKFEYSIEKKGYESYSSMDSIDNQVKNILVELKYLPKAKRLYTALNIAIEWPVTDFTRESGMFGFTLGVLGKTGVFGSLIHINSPSANTKKFGMVSGITQQLGKSLYIYGGPGYLKRNYVNFQQQNLVSESFNFYTGIIFRIGTSFLLKLDYGKSLNNSYQSVGLGLGFSFLL